MLKDAFKEAFMRNMLIDDGNFDWVEKKKEIIH
jgi:hypothetical protein